ncbi:Reelin [Manis pentadactyla]|nr:Reelin [Manis pentadactyla]
MYLPLIRDRSVRRLFRGEASCLCGELPTSKSAVSISHQHTEAPEDGGDNCRVPQESTWGFISLPKSIDPPSPDHPAPNHRESDLLQEEWATVWYKALGSSLSTACGYRPIDFDGVSLYFSVYFEVVDLQPDLGYSEWDYRCRVSRTGSPESTGDNDKACQQARANEQGMERCWFVRLLREPGGKTSAPFWLWVFCI